MHKSRTKVIVLGSTGMLGSLVLNYLSKIDKFSVKATCRNDAEAESIKSYPDVEFRVLDAEKSTIIDIQKTIKDVEWVINCIGVIKPYIHDDDAEESERAIRINSLFPYNLSKAAVATNSKIIQIATDCVYSGQKGTYTETDVHDAIDVYGKTKSLGEAYLPNVYNLRCSIIGPELKSHISLMDWFLGQSKGAKVNGFTNHQWNGVTTLQYAKICTGMIESNITFTHMQHIIPGNLITKADMLRSFAKEFNRTDISISDVEAPKVIDRTLDTNRKEMNQELWSIAGYNVPPTVEEMIKELSLYNFNKSTK